jgi:hypothetical protein
MLNRAWKIVLVEGRVHSYAIHLQTGGVPGMEKKACLYSFVNSYTIFRTSFQHTLILATRHAVYITEYRRTLKHFLDISSCLNWNINFVCPLRSITVTIVHRKIYFFNYGSPKWPTPASLLMVLPLCARKCFTGNILETFLPIFFKLGMEHL